MNINELIKRAHDNAKDKGFYDCGECGGRGYFGEKKSVKEMHEDSQFCVECNGTGKADRNIGELLMLIVSELGEAMEAHRVGRFARWDDYEWQLEKSGLNESESFKENIKDTFEDEIADVFIRLFDLCGYLEIEYEFPYDKIVVATVIFKIEINVAEQLYHTCKVICNATQSNNNMESAIIHAMQKLYNLCHHMKIPIEKHILAKMAYNETREYKHGKKY
jgi:NTP pyrophosphatase (non-canonical NTP hydrolase)